MIIKQLEFSDLHPNILEHFNRYENVSHYWKNTSQIRELKEVSYIRDWDINKKIWAVNYLTECIKQGSIVVGAFDENKLIGFVQIGNKLYGSVQQYINLDLLIISNECRHQGIGRRLFMSAVEKAIFFNAKSLYISAHSSEGSIAFYKKMGCKDAQEIISELIDTPDDWQLEYTLL